MRVFSPRSRASFERSFEPDSTLMFHVKHSRWLDVERPHVDRVQGGIAAPGRQASAPRQ